MPHLPSPISHLRAQGALSIIIPTLNEAHDLPATLTSIQSQNVPAEIETIIADGGSTDATISIAKSASCRTILCPKPGRALQMNHAAALATGETLIFLHADTHLLPGTLTSLQNTLAQDQNITGGGFARTFRSPSLTLRFTTFLGYLRSRYFALHFGDQAIFARRKCFEKIGGFPAIPYFEDFEFSLRLKDQGPTAFIRPGTQSSARRFNAHTPLKVFLSDFAKSFRYLTSQTPKSYAHSLKSP